MKLFLSLYKKELRAMRSNFLIILAAIVALNVFLMTRVASWGYWNALLMSIAPPLALLFFGGMLQAFLLVRDEWKAGTAPFLRSLPISGWGIVGAKMLAAFTSWVAMSLVTLVLSGIFHTCAPWFGMEWLPLAELPWSRMIGCIVLVVLGLMGAVLFGGIVLQLAYLLGRVVNRFNGLLSAVAGVALMYVATRGGDWLAGVLSFLPDITVEVPFNWSEGFTLVPQTINSGAIVVLVLELALLFWAAGWLMEKKAES